MVFRKRVQIKIKSSFRGLPTVNWIAREAAMQYAVVPSYRDDQE